METIVRTLVNSQSNETMEIFYKNGDVIEGFVSRVNPNFNPPHVVFTAHDSRQGDHTIDFPNIVKLVVKPYGKDPYTIENLKL